MRILNSAAPSRRNRHLLIGSKHRISGVIGRRIDQLDRRFQKGLTPGQAVVVRKIAGKLSFEEISQASLLAIQSDASQYHLLDSNRESAQVFRTALYELAISEKYVSVLIRQNASNAVNVHFFDELSEVDQVLAQDKQVESFDFSQPIITPENIAAIDKAAAKIIIEKSKLADKELIRRIDGKLTRLTLDGEPLSEHE